MPGKLDVKLPEARNFAVMGTEGMVDAEVKPEAAAALIFAEGLDGSAAADMNPRPPLVPMKNASSASRS